MDLGAEEVAQQNVHTRASTRFLHHRAWMLEDVEELVEGVVEDEVCQEVAAIL
jgi:hypothetical protein